MTRRKPKPYHRITQADRNKVQLMVSVGQSHEQIADVLGISLATLREYFGDQLKHGAARTEAALLEKLWDSGTKERNSASMRAMGKLIGKAKAKASRPIKAPERPGIDRDLTVREQNEFAKWAHRGIPEWEHLIDDPPGVEPSWCAEYRAWLTEQRGDTEPDD